MWLEAHPSFASCGRPKPSSIYRDPPRTRQRTLILAAFLPWGGSDDTVTRRTGHQHTRFSPSRAAAPHQIHKRARITAVSCGQSADHHNLGTGSVTRRFLRTPWDSHPEPRRSIVRHHVHREATVTPPVTDSRASTPSRDTAMRTLRWRHERHQHSRHRLAGAASCVGSPGFARAAGRRRSPPPSPHWLSAGLPRPRRRWWWRSIRSWRTRRR